MEPIDPPEPVLPDYEGACTSNIVPAILGDPADAPAWLPSEISEANQVVLLVLDGLGWEQFEPRRGQLAHLAAMHGQRITTVAPTTTATALTSISTGSTPGEHGVMGYRIAVNREVLNVLRWTTHRGDARQRIPPTTVARGDAFEGHRPPIVVRTEFEHSGFSEAHLRGCRFVGYRMPSTLATEVGRLLRGGEPFVYAYYDGIDKVAHEYGLGEHYEAELAAADSLVGFLVSILPPGACLVITADHGHLEIGNNVLRPDSEVLSRVAFQSGEARFRWLHAIEGAEDELLEAATACHSDTCWVMSRDEIVSEGWFGPTVRPDALARLGDVALVTHADVAFDEPTDTGPYDLVGRHGSMTSGEVYVPLFSIGN